MIWSFFFSIGRNLNGFLPKMKIFGKRWICTWEGGWDSGNFTMENSPILVEPQHGSNFVGLLGNLRIKRGDSMFLCDESQEADSLLREAQVLVDVEKRRSWCRFNMMIFSLKIYKMTWSLYKLGTVFFEANRDTEICFFLKRHDW